MMDRRQKYVRLKDYNQVIIFSPHLNHDTFKALNPVSAGFCYINDDEVSCFGESISLNMKSDNKDSFYATKQIFGIDKALKL